ncbi:hypothetical protein KIL84_021455 [Mauremys mutica]|uniref:Uncharacterized protein n=1 Tax=Mauremys mutica TaxID=74926 RepID=A0A9D3X880_9SAUR|nr:hypothetical protein KIL84_021455 [Mauremys mutica]
MRSLAPNYNNKGLNCSAKGTWILRLYFSCGILDNDINICKSGVIPVLIVPLLPCDIKLCPNHSSVNELNAILLLSGYICPKIKTFSMTSGDGHVNDLLNEQMLWKWLINILFH